MRHVLVRKTDGVEVKPGDMLVDVRFQQGWKFISFHVQSPPSTGKVTVEREGAESAYYPSVFGLEIREVE